MIDEDTLKAAVDAVHDHFDVKIKQLEARNDTIHKELRNLAETVSKLREDLIKNR